MKEHPGLIKSPQVQFITIAIVKHLNYVTFIDSAMTVTYRLNNYPHEIVILF